MLWVRDTTYLLGRGGRRSTIYHVIYEVKTFLSLLSVSLDKGPTPSLLLEVNSFLRSTMKGYLNYNLTIPNFLDTSSKIRSPRVSHHKGLVVVVVVVDFCTSLRFR